MNPAHTDDRPWVAKQDLHSKAVALTGAAFAFVLILLALFLWWVYGGGVVKWQQLSRSYSVEEFPRPRVLENPDRLLKELEHRASQDADSYAWADERRTEAKVPIRRALEIAARRELIHLRPEPDQGGPHAP